MPADISYAGVPVTKPPNWHGLVALDVLFNNLATGVFLVAALGELAAPEIFTAVARVAYPLALGLLLADLVCLVLDLGDPRRFHHLLRVFKPSSPMSLGTWCLTVFALPLTVLALHSLLPGEMLPAWVRRAAVIIGVVPALGAAVYKGVLFSTSSQPGWKDARWMGAYFTTSAFLLGCAVLLALAILTGQERVSVILHPALVLLLILNTVALGLLLNDVRATLLRMGSRRSLARLGALVLGGGMLVPLLLLLIGGLVQAMIGVLGLVAGAVAVRFLIVAMPHAAAGVDRPEGAV